MIEWRPSKGVDYEQAGVALDLNYCADSRNFLFERGVARTRPHAFWTDALLGGKVVEYEHGFLAYDRLSGRASIYTDGTINALTGSATSFGDSEYHNIVTSGSNVLIGNNVGGLIHYGFSDSSYTINANAKYRYFAPSLSRAVAGYDITSGAVNQRTFAWSVTGDPTDWSGVGAGTSELSGVSDGITGLKSIGSVVVILRDAGISLAYLTGSNTSGPFRFENVIQDGVGCPWPSTVADHNNTVYFVGPDDVYAYRIKQDPQPIGRAVRDRVHHDLSQGEVFQGVVVLGDPKSTTNSGTADIDRRPFCPHARYHLIPTKQIGNHYCLDIETMAWSTHSYNDPIQAVTSGRMGLTYSIAGGHPVWGLRMHSDGFWVEWVDGSPGVRNEVDPPEFTEDNFLGGASRPDAEAFIRSPEIMVGGGTRDYTVDGVTVVWRSEAPVKDPPEVKLELACKEKYKPVSKTSTRSLGELDVSNTWQRTNFDTRVCGNNFEVKITVPDGLKIAIGAVQLNGKDFAEVRTSAYAG